MEHFSRRVLMHFAALSNRLLINILKALPMKQNYIVLESEGDYTDNIRTFYEYMIQNYKNKDYKIIWIVHNPKDYPQVENVEFVSRFGTSVHWKADYYIAVSHFFIFSHPSWMKKWRKNQVVIHTTHSASQLKKTECLRYQLSDYALACGEFVADYRCKKFLLPRDHMLTIGMPRIDLMYRHKECMPSLIPEYKGEKVILAMPTMKKALNWDDSSVTEDFAINIVHSAEDMKKLDDFLADKNWYMIIKIHHLQNLTALQTCRCRHILYVKDSDLIQHDIQVNELLENADVLLSDYSSVFYEYLLLNRPIGFLIADIDEYTRGFEWDNILDEMPGYKIKTLNDFEMFLNDIISGKDDYEKERMTIKNRIFLYDDAKNCERLMRWIDRKSTNR